MPASIWSILFWTVALLVALLVLLVIALFITMFWIDSVKQRRTIKQLKSNNPEDRKEAAKQLRDEWRRAWSGKRVDFDWRSRDRDVKLLIDALPSTNTKSPFQALIRLGNMGTAQSVPKLILLLDSPDDGVALIAAEAISAIRERFEKGWGSCPRCESSHTTEGNYSGWRCQTCKLRYSPKGSRDPMAFGFSGGFHGGPWDRHELVTLLDAVNELESNDLPQGRKGEMLGALSKQADQILAKRQQILKGLGVESR